MKVQRSAFNRSEPLRLAKQTFTAQVTNTTFILLTHKQFMRMKTTKYFAIKGAFTNYVDKTR